MGFMERQQPHGGGINKPELPPPKPVDPGKDTLPRVGIRRLSPEEARDTFRPPLDFYDMDDRFALELRRLTKSYETCRTRYGDDSVYTQRALLVLRRENANAAKWVQQSEDYKAWANAGLKWRAGNGVPPGPYPPGLSRRR
jgi:hypothetical protein